MRILLTGAGGNMGRALAPMLAAEGHQLVLSDIVRPAWLETMPGAEFHQLDIQVGAGLDFAARDCDLIVHLPAWHGIHVDARTEVDFWRLNVDGTFWALRAARVHGIRKFVFLSSQAWHQHYDKYGFTKRIGEELLEYQRRQVGLSYVAVRPADLTPWGSNWPRNYGRRLLYGGVDRDDVLAAIILSIAFLERSDSAGLVVDALRPNAFSTDQLEGWEDAPLDALERIFQGSTEIVQRYGLDIAAKPQLTTSAGWVEIGYAPKHHFGTFINEALGMSEEDIRSRVCPY